MIVHNMTESCTLADRVRLGNSDTGLHRVRLGNSTVPKCVNFELQNGQYFDRPCASTTGN